MATIKDVAREANVAISTVSNVLNNVDVVTQETRDAVMQAVEKLNYTPNLNGRFLKKSKTNCIGLFITNIEGGFYSDFINAIYTKCCDEDYGLNIFLNTEKNIDDSFYVIMGKRVDGAIILNFTVDDSHIEAFKRVKMPVVFADREVIAPTITSINIDNTNGIKNAVQYLIKIGHKDIGYIHGPLNNYDEKNRYKGYKMALEENNIEIKEEYELKGYFSQSAAYNAVRALIETGGKLPEAFVAANDLMAIGCIEALKDMGYRVPEDISVIGFDNADKGQYYTPAITTVDSCPKDLGVAVVESLLEIIRGEKTPEIKKIPTKLVIRDSCKVRF